MVWDEIVPMQKNFFEPVGRFKKDICENKLPLAGKRVVFSDYFRQILPIIPGWSRVQIIRYFFKFSKLYCSFKKYILSQNMILKHCWRNLMLMKRP